MQVRYVVLFCLLSILAACNSDKAENQAVTDTQSEQGEHDQNTLKVKAESEAYDGRPAATLRFNAILAATQNFDELLHIEGKDGEKVDGSWALDADGKILRFPFLEANKTFHITIKAELLSATGLEMGEQEKLTVFTGPLAPLLGFAGQGMVLPAHETRGLPVVSVNVPELDAEFFRVRDKDVHRFIQQYLANGRRSYWELEQISKIAESVFATRFALDSTPNERTLSYLPLREFNELSESGLYFAVIKPAGSYDYQLETAMFFVSDIGVHTRAYVDTLSVHTASLQSGKPMRGVKISVRDKHGKVVANSETDASGMLNLNYKLNAEHVLIAEQADDLSFLSFNQPALDFSEFTVAGRPQRNTEIFPWSGRDLYRPGESVHVAALLRDADGKPIANQTLYATLRQPDNRIVVQKPLTGSEQGYFEFDREIAFDAPTGRWSLDFSTDPTRSTPDHAFKFRVEEFLPERLKLEVNSTLADLQPAQKLPLTIAADYLYGAPAAGNRITGKLAVAVDAHPVASLPDFYFGDALTKLPTAPVDVIDESLDEQGKFETKLEILSDTEVKTPIQVALQVSVFETGGRAVSRNLKRTIWPTQQLVGVRPLFVLAEGSPYETSANFEVIRSQADGSLLAAENLQLKLIRERRDYNWVWDTSGGWRADFTARNETVETQTLNIKAGERALVKLNVEWGQYQVEITDPQTQLVTRLAFQAGWGSQTDSGNSARPDKIKITLDKPNYRVGETLVATLTPPHSGPAVIFVEGDKLLWHTTLNVEAGSKVEIPLDPSWNRHDLYISALVFRPASMSERITPKRAVGIAHIPLDRSDRTVAVTLQSAETMRPKQAMPIQVEAKALAGQTAQVRITAVDLGVLNITRYPLPNAGDWFFAPRRLATNVYDMYSRIIESLDGEMARQRYGGDMALPSLPGSRRPNAEIKTVDLWHAPVKLDAQGRATINLDVPDFNGTLRVRALVFGDEKFGAAENDTIVRAALVVEASTPRVMAMGDQSQLTLDVQNMSGAKATFNIDLQTSGPISLQSKRQTVTLDDKAKRTFSFVLNATGANGVGEIRAVISGNNLNIERVFRTVVRPAWADVSRVSNQLLEQTSTVRVDNALLQDLIPETVNARISISALPPLPFAASAKALVDYPYGCAEQTSSKALPLVLLDQNTMDKLGIDKLSINAPGNQNIVLDAASRSRMLDTAFARLSSMQTESGHFAMWPGSDYISTYITPVVTELLLLAKEGGHPVPEAMLEKALKRLNDDLLSGGNHQYHFEHSEHLRLAEMAHAGYLLARAGRAPVGSLRSLLDNQSAQFITPLPLAHLAAALALVGDKPRAEKAVALIFEKDKKWNRPEFLGDYGSQVRDQAMILALLLEQKLATPEHQASAITIAREQMGNGEYLSTQDRAAILRLGHALSKNAAANFAASINVAGTVSESTGRSVVSRLLNPSQLAAGASITARGGFPLYAISEVSGVPRKAQVSENTDLNIRRSWYHTDGSPYTGTPLQEGDMLIAQLLINSAQVMNDAMIVDLLPGGLEIENLNISDPSQWENIEIDGQKLNERSAHSSIRFEEYRDDRYVAAVDVWTGNPVRLYYLARAVSPGSFIVPNPSIEDMYRPALRAVGRSEPARIVVRGRE